MNPSPSPKLSDFENFRTYLAAWHAERQRKDPTFTRSEFARRLGVPNSRGLLGEIIEGRKLTDSFIERFVTAMELPPEDARLFRVRVRYEQASSDAERSLFRPHLSPVGTETASALAQNALDGFQGIAPGDLDETCRQIVETTRTAIGHVRAGLLLLEHPDATEMRGTWGTDHRMRTTDERSFRVNRYETIDRVLDHFAKTGRRWQLRSPASITFAEGEERVAVARAWVEGHLLSTPRRHLGVLYVDPGLSLRDPDPLLQEATSYWAKLVSPLVERLV